MRQVKKRGVRWAALLAIALLGAAPSQGEEGAPDARSILEGVRAAQSQTEDTLTGRLRLGDGRVVPFRLRLQGPEVTYEFSDPPETVGVQLSDAGSQVRQTTDGHVRAVTGADLLGPVRGSDLAFEDLSFRFLYWPRATLEGEGSVKAQPCYVVLVQPVGAASQYGSVRLWITKEGGALLRAEGYDRKAQLVKRFELISGQKLRGRWWLKQMRIERLDPSTHRVLSRTYLEADAPADG